ncbi:MAG: nitrogen fixation protein NifX [Alphaproteobacteria bacterium]|nr:nitrogen fixation protein NifX [Alphaproteobacteria bacterium]
MITRRLQLITPAPPGTGGTMRIAIATQDMKRLDAHFGSTRRFAVYDVSKEGHRFVEAIQFETISGEDGHHADDGEDRIGPKVEALKGCALLFVLAIGGPAAARVIAARIHPIKVQQPESIEAVLSRVQTMLSGTPPPWLRKIVAQERPDFLDEETET